MEEKTTLVGLLGSVIATGGSATIIHIGKDNIGPLLLIYIIVAIALILLAMDYVEKRERDKRNSELLDASEASHNTPLIRTFSVEGINNILNSFVCSLALVYRIGLCDLYEAYG